MKTSLNTYTKFCPNVFVAKCEEKHSKGDIITLTTKYGKEHECEVFNFIGQTRDNHFLYSIVRTDGFNTQERAKQKAEKLNGYAVNAEKRSDEYYKKSNQHSDFLSLGEPIKVGHHSEKRHRKIIQQSWDNMGKSVAESDKAKEYERRSEYWESKANDINLSMPESLEYYEFKLEEATNEHTYLKENPDKRKHSYSLTYAKKAVNEARKNLELAVKLWGSEEEQNQVAEEKKEAAKSKNKKGSKMDKLIDKYGGFFAFNKNQFKEGYDTLKASGYVEEGDKVTHLKHGLYTPSKTVKEFINEL